MTMTMSLEWESSLFLAVFSVSVRSSAPVLTIHTMNTYYSSASLPTSKSVPSFSLVFSGLEDGYLVILVPVMN